MDTIASASLTQMASVGGGGGGREVQHAFASLANVEPQDEFQAAMFQYARASLQLLESLRLCPPPEETTIGPCSPSTTTGTMLGPYYSSSALDDVSKVNLLHSLTEYTDSRLNLASFSSFPSTPFDGTRSASLTRSFSGDSDRSPQEVPSQSCPKELLKRERPSMCSRHLLNTLGRLNSTFSTQQSNDTVFEHTGHQEQVSGLKVPTYEALEAADSPESSATLNTVRYREPSGQTIFTEAANEEVSRGLPGRRETVVGPLETIDTLDTPGNSHAHNTAFCKALALQAIRDLSPRLSQPAGKPPRLRPLGGSSSMRTSQSEVIKPRVRRRHSINQESLYMTYRAPPAWSGLPPPAWAASGLPPPKPAKNFSSETLHARLSSLYLSGDIDCSEQVHGSFTTVQQRPQEPKCASPKAGTPSFLKKAISLFRPRSLKHKTAKPQTVNHIYDYKKCKTL